MKIVHPSFDVEFAPSYETALSIIEKAGRTCYKSERETTVAEREEFVAQLIRSGHESVIEHVSVTGRIICDRGISHEIVRHRIASYSQESTRYVNYARERMGKSISVICPTGIASDSKKFDIWYKQMQAAEESYFALIEAGCTAQQARSVLPTCLKTELVCTMNLREWRHFIRLRSHSTAHPDMQVIAQMVKNKLCALYPIIFSDL